jgi:hypothetical protein
MFFANGAATRFLGIKFSMSAAPVAKQRHGLERSLGDSSEIWPRDQLYQVGQTRDESHDKLREG